jgi:voltage-gated potassium channel
VTDRRPFWLKYLFLLAPLLVLLAGAGFATLEKDTVSSYWEGLWWSLSLMTTVGFVGETPETVGGRILSALLMISGFALLTLATATIASLFVREDEAPEEQREREFEAAVLGRLEELATRLEQIVVPLERDPDDRA